MEHYCRGATCGLSMVNATGVISGVPTTVGSNSATFEVTDASAGGKMSSAPGD